ncbi:DUF2867 domain-containing protein [Vibrio quintilis]|uniref:DUF2867 domain-containing protein n=1 Tax=Vibrio quintilis TaxID=1117707 RepID=A0A1M7Z2H5_9VIBR|nr:DUF2867 domain-containing protein [Vibrio quintilis]SHO59169.1 hypothetical protein VQ7734_04949 [Vibrio quintilis]
MNHTNTIISSIPVSLPGHFLPQANWADCYEIVAKEKNLKSPAAVAKMFSSQPPWWIKALNGVRNKIVGLIGIKSGEISVDQQQAGAFPIVSQSEQTTVMGFDDWHLNFRVVVETMEKASGTRVRLSTFVQRRNWFGYLYIFLITPFHKLIVRRLLKNLS